MSKESYDAVPYPTGSIQYTQPERLAGALAWAGWAAPPLERARVLEIGCATGGNLVPLAVRHPDWDCVGVDYSPVQIQAASALAQQMGVGNVRFVAASVEEITPDWGQFDYILTHGVYSWVPEPVQAAILRVSAENLAPQGVAYISFNTLPGWHWRGVIRDFLLQFTPPALAGAAKVAHALKLLQNLQAATPEDSPMGRLLKREVPGLLKAHPSYILHEFYESDNRPLHVAEFMRRARAAGLQRAADVAEPDVDGLLLSDAQVALMQTVVGADVPAAAGQGADHTAAALQMRDYLQGESFHRALLVHAGRQPERARAARLRDRLEGLGLAGQFMPHPNPKAPPGALLCRLSDHALAAPTVAQRPVIEALQAAWPGAIAVDALLAPGLDEAERETYLRALIADGAVRVLGAPAALRGNPGAPQPQIDRCCRLQLAAGLDTVTTLAHETFRPDAMQVQIMRLADGTRSATQLAQALKAWATQHPEQLVDSAGRRIDAQALRPHLPQLVTDFLAGPAQEAGLLAPA